MNLHGIVRPLIRAVNPDVEVTIQVSTGFTTDARGKRTPTFAAPVTVTAQVQPLQGDDLKQIDGLTLQGERRKIFISGRIDGMNRENSRGGDLVTFADGTVWKVAVVTDAWPDWTAAIITRQDGE